MMGTIAGRVLSEDVRGALEVMIRFLETVARG
jgi:hypothetical protein